MAFTLHAAPGLGLGIEGLGPRDVSAALTDLLNDEVIGGADE